MAGIERSWMKQALQPMVLIAVTAMTSLACSTHASVAFANTDRSAGIGYLCFAVVQLCCALAFWMRARAAEGRLRIRWAMIATAALTAGIGYLPSFTQSVLGMQPQRQLQTAFLNSSEALYMLAAVLFFAGVARSIVIVDILQALLFVLLRFNLTYSPATRDHFALDHLLVSQLVALFFFLVAMVACLGAASREELGFLRILTWFFGLRLIEFFLANEVSYSWMHCANGSEWDVPGPVLMSGFALYLLYTGSLKKAGRPDMAPLLEPSVTVRSLMPSFLALVNLMLGLFVLRVSVPLAVAAISVTLVCSVARTVLLQAQTVREKSLLESRNEQLEGLAIRDPLTGIGNRRSLAGVYSRLQVSSGSERLALLLLDVDSFKQANDCLGHLHGDRVLVTLARRLENVAAATAGSHCARLGGDEFALLLKGVSAQEASVLAEELRAQFGACGFETENGRVSLSIGVAALQAARDLPLETLVSYADEALYRAKLLGRDRVEAQPVWEPGRSSSAARALRVGLQHS
jgi:diguanylate cyclase (GGDEF)-like protein